MTMPVVSQYTQEYTEYLKRENQAYSEAWAHINRAFERCEKVFGIGGTVGTIDDRAERIARQLVAYEWRQRKKALERQVFMQAQKLILESLLSEHITHGEKNARLRGMLALIERELDLRPNGDADFHEAELSSIDGIPF